MGALGPVLVCCTALFGFHVPPPSGGLNPIERHSPRGDEPWTVRAGLGMQHALLPGLGEGMSSSAFGWLLLPKGFSVGVEFSVLHEVKGASVAGRWHRLIRDSFWVAPFMTAGYLVGTLDRFGYPGTAGEESGVFAATVAIPFVGTGVAVAPQTRWLEPGFTYAFWAADLSSSRVRCIADSVFGTLRCPARSLDWHSAGGWQLMHTLSASVRAGMRSLGLTLHLSFPLNRVELVTDRGDLTIFYGAAIDGSWP